MNRLSGKIILISGGARGQGAAEARFFVAEGARVVIGDVLEAQGRALAAELGKAAVFVRQDVTQEEDWARAVDAAACLGGLHGLVNNAGIYQPSTLMETDVALFERHMRVNQLGCFLGMKMVVPLMEKSGGGSIVNVSSIAALRPRGLTAYTVSKGAVIALTKALAVDHGPQGIRANCVAPGPVYTPMVYGRGMTQQARDTRRRASVLGLEGTGWDIGAAVRFLLSDQARYITGQTLVVDGGATLVGPSRAS